MQHWMLTLALSTASLLSLHLAGCAGEPRQVPSESVPEGPTVAPVDRSQVEAWCQAYLPPELQSATRQALENNRELATARANLREAEASARAAGAARWPTLSLESSASRSRQPFVGDLPETFPGDLESERTRYRAGAAAQYEIDLWGRLNSEAQAAALEAEATAEDLAAARVSIASELAERWFEMLAQNRLAALLEEELGASEKMLKLTKLRFGQGQTQGLDVVQQRQQTESIAGQLAQARAQTHALSRELATLLGETQEAAPDAGGDLPEPPPLPLEGIPANLLGLRPDLSAAARRMAAADARYAAAVAERLPAVQLSAEVFSQAANVSNLFGSIFWNLMGSVSLVMLDGGRLEARAEAADARAEAALEQFAQSYLTALTEVGTGLILERGQRAQLESLEEQTDAGLRALELARAGYRRGTVDYLRVLSAQQSLLQARQSLIQGRRQLLSYRLQTCRALGFAPMPSSPGGPEERRNGAGPSGGGTHGRVDA